MMKKVLLFALLPFLALAAHAQESRQDISLSGANLFPPYTYGNAVKLTTTLGFGGLVSYRYMLTPRSALEGNYQYDQDVQKFIIPTNNTRVHTRFQEFSAAYVYNFTFKNFNPFIEAGVGGFFWTPIDDQKTNTIDAKSQTQIGGLYGAGIAYELSPSFDLRVEYRGLIMKTPTFGQTNLSTGTYYNIYNPVIGIAYHF
ncbi:outer membrane protein [Acidipila rosea]|uniref:Opacity protein-like surface antigen n=1 Tax=Acidipila rosea TaxID=768535 RepID=A0A4R1LAU0_9BACT|nr:outer membrane beta-barrel protein [Acidipila rosea]MBW4026982.1 porin family protein [Acidobacteriota bacterium]MBW4045050.1 porin family protein [Acidobacteriota bacterium]TCK75284.1 opacity protein-like surface antigen [Acidipila rosea]